MRLRHRIGTRRRRLPRQLSDDLRAELDGAAVGFMYPWRLTKSVQVEAIHPELAAIHATREEMLEPLLGQALANGGRVVDLGAHEGWFSQRALDWGATFVLAVDVREINTRRAVLLRDHFGIPAERLELRTASVYDIDPAEVGHFDAVLVLGLIYHLENPVGGLRTAAALAKVGAPVIVDSQLTRQTEAIEHSDGVGGQIFSERASWAARFEPLHEQQDTPLSSFGGVVSLIPNRDALLQSMEIAGLRGIQIMPAASHHHREYTAGDRVVAVGWH